MYVAKDFQPPSEEAALAVVESNPFGVVIACDRAKPVASHTPMLLERRDGKLMLSGHLARANPLGRLLHEQEVLAIFHGPHTHISPTWYATQPAVPTWDYVAVHLTGRAVLLERGQPTVESLSRQFEGDRWRLGDQPPRFAEMMLKGITAFEIEVTSVEASFKLSQNRSKADRLGVIAGLRARSAPGDLETADLIEAA